MHRYRQQTGFTLIELIIVITILAILAAMALPRFAHLQTEARIAKMQGALGSMRSAAAMAHAMLLARGYEAGYGGNPSSPDINIEGVDVVYVNGYPARTVIAQLAGIAAPEYVVNVPSTGSLAIIEADANHPDCEVVYTEAAVGQQPTYTTTGLTVANCD